MVWITTTNPVTSRGVAPLDSPKREVAKAPAPVALKVLKIPLKALQKLNYKLYFDCRTTSSPYLLQAIVVLVTRNLV